MKYITIKSRPPLNPDDDDLESVFKIPVIGGDTLRRLVSSTRWPAQLSLIGGRTVSLFDVARMVAEDSHPGDDGIGPQHLLNCARAGDHLHRLAKLIPEGGVLHVTPAIARACHPKDDDESLQVLAGMAFDDLDLDLKLPHGRCGADNAALILMCGALLFEAKRLERSLLFAGQAA